MRALGVGHFESPMSVPNGSYGHLDRTSYGVDLSPTCVEESPEETRITKGLRLISGGIAHHVWSNLKRNLHRQKNKTPQAGLNA